MSNYTLKSEKLQPEKPEALEVDFEAIERYLPDLTKRPQWVCWRYEQREDGKWTKPPRKPFLDRFARANRPSSWSDYQSCKRAVEKGHFDGVGFVLSADDIFCGLDWDKCIKDGHIREDVLSDLESLNTYAEVSPSGKGVRALAVGKVSKGHNKGKREAYSQARYFTITGQVLGGYAKPPQKRQKQIDAFVAKYFPVTTEKKPSVDLRATGEPLTAEDEALIEAIGEADPRFYIWWKDGVSEGDDHSAVDLAFCSKLARRTQDPRQIDRIFRHSGLMRQKWDRRHSSQGETYGEMTMGKALNDIIPLRPHEQGQAQALAQAKPTKPKRKAKKGKSKGRSIAQWEQVTTADVRQAIEDTPLETIVSVLEGQLVELDTGKPLPLPMTILPALVLAGAALSEPVDNPAEGSIGADRLRVRIASTASGQACNVYGCLVAPSRSGKDAGQVMVRAARKCGLLLGTQSSAEGFYDAVADCGNGILRLSEMQNLFSKASWESKLPSALIDMFSSGMFRVRLSTKSRESDFAFPSVYGSVQPGVIQKLATKLAFDNGFFARLLWSGCEVNRIDKPNPNAPSEDAVVGELKRYQTLRGVVPVADECDRILRLVPTVPEKLQATVKTIANEYTPRFTVILSRSVTPKPEDWQRARVLANWFVKQAYQTLETVGIGSTWQEDRLAEIKRAILDALPRAHEGWSAEDAKTRPTLRRLQQISRAVKQAPTKARQEALTELVEDGEVTIEQVGAAEILYVAQ